jgi:thiol-disulfide isomerase/thioredoxin
MRISVKIIAVILLITVGCKPAQDGSIASKMRLTELNGEAIDLGKYKGKTVFINVWATWCGSCVQEMPSIRHAQSVLQNKNIEFLFASNEGKERIESFESERQLGLHYVQLENLEEMNIMALPTTYVLNANGEVVFSESGFRKWDDESNIQLLNEIIDNNE